jgi:hypothetical protein
MRCQWQSAYVIGLCDGVWSASRNYDPTVVLTADTPQELRALMQDHPATHDLRASG